MTDLLERPTSKPLTRHRWAFVLAVIGIAVAATFGASFHDGPPLIVHGVQSR